VGTGDGLGEVEVEGEGEDAVEIDEDGDGFSRDDDCDDLNSAVNPGAVEVCNDIDDDCDSDVDEGVQTVFYADADGDTYGDPITTVEACAAPDGYVADDTDCDDGQASTNPAATEVCNEVDDDCDALVDEEVATLFYADTDGDTFGDPDEVIEACSAPDGYVADGTDCDDTARDVNPSGTEVCNGVDDDCNADTSEDGMVAFIDTAGSTTDVSGAFTGAVSMTTDGTYMVCDGTYAVHLDIDADVDIVGVNGALGATLDGEGTGPVVTVDNGNTVNLSALTLTNGIPDNFAGSFGGGGGGVNVSAGSTVDISDSVLSDHMGYLGGAIHVYEASLTVNTSTFFNNGSTNGGDFMVIDGDAVITGCSSTDAYADYSAYGYVLGYEGEASLEIDDSTFDGGFTTGVGLYAASAFGFPVEFVISSSAVTNLSASSYGALTVYGDATAASFDTDWGTTAGRDDNLPVDVHTTSGSTGATNEYSYGDGEFFTCTGAGCANYVEYEGANATLYHAWTGGGSTSAPSMFACELDFNFVASPTTDLCHSCDYGFEGTWVLDTSTANTSSCFYYTEDFEMDIAFAADPTYYSSPVLYTRSPFYDGWLPTMYATRSGDTVVATYGFYNYAVSYYGTYYYYSDYLKIDLEVY